MTTTELKELKVGDRVRWVSEAGHADGTVVEKKHGVATILWDDGVTKLCIGWRSSFDREKGKKLVKLPPAPTGNPCRPDRE